MGCISVNSKDQNRSQNTNQEYQIANPWKIHCLEPQNSINIPNQHMPTHDSLREDRSSEIQGAVQCSPQCKGKENEDPRVKKSRNVKTKDGQLKGLSGKLGSKFLINRVNKGQATQSKQKLTRHSSIKVKEEKDCQENEQEQEKSKKVQIIKLFAQKKPILNIIELENDNRFSSLDEINVLANDQTPTQVRKGSAETKSRPKKVGFRSPRGRSENLFKTFEDDYIEEEPQFAMKKKESQSMGKILN